MIDTLWSDWLELQVLLDLGDVQPGDYTFTLDDPTNGQLDYAVLGSPTAPYADVTCDVRSLSWRFGATRSDGVLTRWEAGSASVVLDNNDRQYLVGDDDSPILPMAGLVIQARIVQGPFASTDWTVQFRGYVNVFAVAFDPLTSDATLNLAATDGTAVLTAYENRAAGLVGAGESASARVTRILNQAEWTDARNIGPGGIALAATDLSGDAWSQLVAVNDAELGAVFIAPDGTATFISRVDLYNRLLSTDAAAYRWGPGDREIRYEDVVIAIDDSQLRNIVDAQRTGGAAQIVRDNASVARFRPHKVAATVPVNADSDALAWASFVLELSEQPTPRVDAMTVMPRTDPLNLWPAVIGAQFADHWSVSVDPVASASWAGLTRDVLVRGWSTTVDREDWTTVYVLSDHETFTPFILDAVPTRLDIARLSA
jgi:hypothetical protein